MRVTIYLLIGLFAGAAHSEIVTWRASGHVLSVNDPGGQLPLNPEVGAAFGIDFTIDLSVTDSYGADAPYGDRYGFYNAVSSAVVSTSGMSFVIPVVTNLPLYPQSGVNVYNNSPTLPAYGDLFRLVGSSVNEFGSVGFYAIALLATAPTDPGPFTSDALPLTPPDPSAFPFVRLLEFGYFNSQITASFDSLEPVPLPGALALMLSGSGLLLVLRGRRALPPAVRD